MHLAASRAHASALRILSAAIAREEAALNATRDTNAVLLRDMLATAASSAGNLECNGATLADMLPGNPHPVTSTLYQKAIAWTVRLGGGSDDVGAARVLQLQLELARFLHCLGSHAEVLWLLEEVTQAMAGGNFGSSEEGGGGWFRRRRGS
ncbi:hypothetical protein NpPPO83_00010960 [Neofusicoccum parvum]|uniref:Uncharacterized protein n=1 Tax=Neofusicoccum parvum TaxID=310453 RepID=A0ACB5SDI6_9PEZI|nr:hypothetical protein NpPPO83_00010960 [Neofusicoccum parvum]